MRCVCDGAAGTLHGINRKLAGAEVPAGFTNTKGSDGALSSTPQTGSLAIAVIVMV
jgi:hypothetical protein